MKNKLKILIVTEYFPPKIMGGGEISAYLLAKNLAKKGIDVSVLTSHFEGLRGYEEKEGIKIYRRLKTGGNPNSLFDNLKRVISFRSSVKNEIKKIEQEIQVDIIHFLNTTSIVDVKTWAKKVATINGYAPFCPKGNLFYKEKTVCDGCNPFKFMGCITCSEYVGKSRIGWYLRYNPLFWLFAYLPYTSRRKSLKSIDKFIAISDFVKNTLKNHRVEESRISKAYNIAEIPDNNLQLPEIKKQAKGKKVITVIGALEKIKGVDIAIKSFSKIKDKKTLLLIVGEGSEKNKLKKIAKDMNVLFAGKVDQKYIPFIYKNSDLILLTSLWPEPFSRVPMEAAFFRKPVLASAVGGNLDLQKTYLFRNQRELTEKIDKFLSKKQSSLPFLEYSPEKNIIKIISFYKLPHIHNK